MTAKRDSAQVARIQLSELRVGKRHRALDKFKVAAFAKSMAGIGLQHPISVYAGEDGAHLVAGRHRVEAAKSLGWKSIACIFVELDEVDREIWEIDENLMRAGLSKAEEREHFKRRKELWEKRQAAHHAPIESKRADGKGHRPKGFAADTAAATGLSKSQINRLIAEPAVSGAGGKVRKAVARATVATKPNGAGETSDSELDRRGEKSPKPVETYRAPFRRKPKLETCTSLEAARHFHIEKTIAAGASIEEEIELFAAELRAAAAGAAPR
jgi:hypothetical protein